MSQVDQVQTKLRGEFPLILNQGLIYLDSAATTLKPSSVLETKMEFYRDAYATVNRSLYPRAQKATQDYLLTRTLIAKKISSSDSRGIIFTKGATDGLNQAAHFLTQLIPHGAEILISPLEHHANYLPFKALEKKGVLRVIDLPIHKDGKVDWDSLEKMDTSRVKALSIAHVSNVTGAEQDIKRLGDLCQNQNWIFIVDAAQSIATKVIDVEWMRIDFMAFSAHKMYGPTGVGALYIAPRFLDLLEPLTFGGDMIAAFDEEMIYQPAPFKFEAGTPPIGEIIGWKAALEWLEKEEVVLASAHLGEIQKRYAECLARIPNVELISANDATTMATLVLKKGHPMDMALLLGQKGIEIRSGSLCALPALKYYNAHAFLRISLGVYNTLDEVDLFMEAFESTLRKIS
ncbi:MAG: aminotransferase class V-fold PLP-dependent enzyme [Chlamydiae bacterium]|nr:aminotransferase class V-fold PLP-dependent enzyme [Chlamydiota bacterium]